MANIASGYVSIKSTDKEFLEDLKNKINDGPFNYAEPADIMNKDNGLDTHFTGRWSCEDAWVFFEDLMATSRFSGWIILTSYRQIIFHAKPAL